MYVHVFLLALATELASVLAARTTTSSPSEAATFPQPVTTVLNKDCNMTVNLVNPSWQYVFVNCLATVPAAGFYMEQDYQLSLPQDNGVFTANVREALKKVRARFSTGFIRVAVEINGKPEKLLTYLPSYAALTLSDDLIRPLGRAGNKDFFATFSIRNSWVKLAGSLASTNKPTDVGITFWEHVSLL